MLLALDTATGAIGAAVVADAQIRSEVTHQDSRRHGELLAPAIQEALSKAGVGVGDLSAVIVGVGPGPFTGLRVGIVSGLVLGQVRGIPVHGVCSLDALAAQAVQDQAGGDHFLVASDARRKEVYWAEYVVDQGRARRTSGPGVARAADLPEATRVLPAVGRGPLLYDVLTRASDQAPVDVSPGMLGLLAEAAIAAGEAPGDLADGILLPPEPLYLRRPDAAVPGPAKVVP